MFCTGFNYRDHNVKITGVKFTFMAISKSIFNQQLQIEKVAYSLGRWLSEWNIVKMMSLPDSELTRQSNFSVRKFNIWVILVIFHELPNGFGSEFILMPFSTINTNS